MVSIDGVDGACPASPKGFAGTGFVRNCVGKYPGLPGRSSKRSFERSLVDANAKNSNQRRHAS